MDILPKEGGSSSPDPASSSQVGARRKAKQCEKEEGKSGKERELAELVQALQGQMMLKVVFGERSKFIYDLPEGVGGLRKQCTSLFGLVTGENPEEVARKSADIEAALEFAYVDPQGDKIVVEGEEDFRNIYKFAEVAQQKLIKLIMSSTCQEIQVYQQGAI